MADRHDRHCFGHPVHRHDVGQLGPVRIFLHVAQHDRQLAGEKAVRIGKGEQQRLDGQPVGRRLGLIGCDRHEVDVASAGERVDEMGVVPRARRHRRIRQIAVDENARRALQAAVDEGDHEPLSAQRNPLVRFAAEQMLVRSRELACQRQRRFRRFERVAAQRMRGARELLFELRPENVGRLPILFGKIEALRIAHRDAVGRGQRVADEACGGGGIALAHVLEP